MESLYDHIPLRDIHRKSQYLFLFQNPAKQQRNMSIVPWGKKMNWVAQTLRKLNHEEICDKKLDWIFQVNAIPNFKVTKSARAKNTTFSGI